MALLAHFRCFLRAILGAVLIGGTVCLTPLATSRASVVSAQSTNGDSRIPSTDAAATTDATRQDMQPFIEQAKLIDPIAGAAIEAAANSGSIGFAWLWNGLGCHDWNTIAIGRDSDVVTGAVNMLHEWVHVCHCGGGPPFGGPTHDGSGCDPCYPCVHMNMQADSHTLMLAQICLLMLQEDRDRLCATAKGVAEVGRKYEQDCVATGCPYTLSHNWNEPCPTCD